MTQHAMDGVFVPVVTPFTADLKVDSARFVQFCRWLVSQGAGLAVFGTNSEANSLSLKERLHLLDRLADSDLDARRMMPGTGACALPDAIELTSRAVECGCGGVLMLPPFYYKGVSDDGLFRYYSEVIQAVGDSALRIYLYHIPQVSGVPITHALIERLITAYPGVVAGIKDSSGEWENTETMLRRFPGFSVFPASEALLGKALPLGAAGCISATANIQPGGIAALIRSFGGPGFEEQQRAVSTVRNLLQQFPMIPALKAVVAHYGSDDRWETVRPPLVKLDPAMKDALIARLVELGFSMNQLTKEG